MLQLLSSTSSSILLPAPVIGYCESVVEIGFKYITYCLYELFTLLTSLNLALQVQGLEC